MRITEAYLRELTQSINNRKNEINFRNNEKLILRCECGSYHITIKKDNSSGESTISGWRLTARETYYFLKGYMEFCLQMENIA